MFTCLNVLQKIFSNKFNNNSFHIISLSKINLKIQNIYIKPILNSLNTDVYASKLLIKVKM
jgi:hypothetical protein